LIAGEVADAEQRLRLRLRLAPGAAGESFERLLLRGERKNRPALYLRDIGTAERVMEPRERVRVNGKPAVRISGRWRNARARAALERFCGRAEAPGGPEFECAIQDPAI
jgi:multidrug efflux pump subunit AcrB